MNSQYSKAIFALLTSVAALVFTAPKLENATDFIQLGILVVGGPVLVFFTSNTKGSVLKYAKAIVAFAVAGATALVPFLTQGHALDYQQWGVVLTAALGAIGVGIVSNSLNKVAVVGTPTVVNVSTVTDTPDTTIPVTSLTVPTPQQTAVD